MDRFRVRGLGFHRDYMGIMDRKWKLLFSLIEAWTLGLKVEGLSLGFRRQL